MIKRCTVLFFSLFIIINLFAERKVTDMLGREVIIPDTVKNIFVDRHSAILLYALDQDIALNRIFNFSNNAKKFFPQSYLEKPCIELGAYEDILKLNPDVIILSDELSEKAMDQAESMQKRLGIPVLMYDMNILSYKKTIGMLGDALRLESRAELLNGFITKYCDEVMKKAASFTEDEISTVYYAEGPKGLNTDPKGSKHSQILELVGARNVAESKIVPGKGLSEVSLEQIMIWNPEKIICWTGSGPDLPTYKEVTGNELWSTVSACKTGNVFQIPLLPFGCFDRPPGSNRILGLLWTFNTLHPSHFQWNINDVTCEYFKLFYHYDLTPEEAETILNPVIN